VYVAGFSAGGAFAAVMLATWPDRFAAGSVMEGIAYECGTSVATAFTCQSPGTTKTPAEWGDLVRAADSGYSGPWPRVQVWAGTSDTTVVPANATELVKQWTNVWATDQTADSTEMLGSNSHSTYLAGSTVAVDLYTVSGMDHAVALGTDAMGTCPGSTGQYFEDHAICSTLRAAKFFGLLGGSGSGGGGGGGTDATPPTVAFQAPTSGATVNGQVELVIAANDNVGVSDVDVSVDGAPLGTITTAPFRIAWDSTMTSDGAHVLTATAHDAAGNAASATANVTVANGGAGGGPGSNGETGSGSGAASLPACSAGGSPATLWPLAFALFALRRRRR